MKPNTDIWLVKKGDQRVGPACPILRQELNFFAMIPNMTKHKTLVKDVFDRASSGYGEKGCSFFDYFGEKLVALAKPTSGDTILDVATGKGAVLLPAAKLVGPQGSAIGIDLSPKMIEKALEKAPSPWIELHQMDAEHLMFPDHSFNIVFCAFALFFFPHIDQALTECKRVLKSPGRLAISVFAKGAPLDLWISEKVKEYGITSRLSFSSLDTIAAIEQQLKKSGFTHVEIHEESKTFWHENAEQWWDSLWTHGIRSKLEPLSPQDLQKLKEEALLHVGSGKVAEERSVFYAIASSNSA